MNKNIKSIIFNLFGQTIFAKIRTIYWAQKLKRNKFYENEINLLPLFIRPGDVCIDIGANFGQYTYPLSKLVGPTGKVFGFEPVKYTFEILKNIVRKLKLTNVEIQNVALSDKSGEAEIIIPVDDLGMRNIGGSYLSSRTESKKGKRETVEVTTLDELMLGLPLPNKITFIKCDVEGAELMVFRGGKDFLSKFHPTILCEIEERHINRYGYSPEELIDFLKNFGYEVFSFVSGKLTLVKEVQKSSINYIFIYKDLVRKFIKNNNTI